MEKKKIEKIASELVDSSYTVHKIMGPGLLESVYEKCLLKELELRGMKARNQVSVPLKYKGFELSKELRIDILLEDLIIVELKSVDTMLPVFDAQLISYLKLTELKLGFLVNFNVCLMKNGLRRFVNDY